jgi:hypothetical protein
MKKTQMIAVAAMLTAGSAIPALAAWNHVGDVQVSPYRYTDVQLGGFTGPVERIRFRSDGRAQCDNIRVRYDNGATREVFSGALYDGQDQTIAFPFRSGLVSAVSFSCRASGEGGAQIAVSADMPGLATPVPVDDFRAAYVPAGEVMLLASRDFGDLDQRTLMLDQAEPWSVRAIALQPVGADARCTSVRAMFADGTASRVTPNNGGELYEGHIYKAYVDGADRDLSGVNLACEAANGEHVKINVYAVG